MKVVVTRTDGQLGRTLIKAASPGAETIQATHAELDIFDSAAISSFRDTRALELCVYSRAVHACAITIHFALPP